MSATNRPTSRWSSSTKSTTNSSINQSTSSLLSSRKKLSQPVINNQPTFSQRMAKTRNDVEQLFKLYYSTNIKFDTFQRQVVTGTRIPSAQTSPLIQNHLTNSSSNVFRSKHCVSREDEDLTDIDEDKIINDESIQLPTKRTVQVRLDNHPIMIPSLSPSPDMIPPPVNSELIIPENNESNLINVIPADSFEYNTLKTNKSTIGQQSTSSIVALPSIPSSTLTLINNQKDLINSSYSSFSTNNSNNRPHIVTGSAVIVRQRSPTKSALNKQRIKSSSQHTNMKTSSASIQYNQPELPLCLGARVVSIPSKCSRYVLLTFPQAPVRYNAPTYVERLLLPERFPTLFQNIVQNRNNK